MQLDNDLRSVQEARQLVSKAKAAQLLLADLAPAQIDNIVEHMAHTVSKHAEELAKMAQQETGFGKWKDKVVKNLFASQRVYEHIKDMNVLGIIKEDIQAKTMDVGVPVGVICALIPSTNPTSTAIYKVLIALKAGNGIVFSPHPNARECSKRTIEILQDAAMEAGAPEGIIGYLETLSLPGTKELMHHKDVAMILATGGEAMVRAAYASGKPTISGGPGNGPAFIERSANISQAVRHIIESKTFDNGVICASEQSIIVEEFILAEVKQELQRNHAYFMSEAESDQLGKYLLKPNGMVNAEVVGKSATFLAEKAGFAVPAETTVLISEQNHHPIHHTNPYSREKLCPVLAFYVEKNWETACVRCIELLTNEGKGHTLVIHTQNEEVVREFALRKPVYRMLVNTPAALGGIGATTNIAPALTLGCGAAGNGSSSDNVSPLHLVNVRKIGYGVCELSELRPNSVPMQPSQPSSPSLNLNNNDELVDVLQKLLSSMTEGSV